jgi:tripeptide aminopeptidase
VFDCSKRPGIYIREAVGLHAFTAEFIGKAAHAGVAPEDGISAIAMAASAISKVPLGRVDAETTANIGKIRGGEAVNIVPDKVVIEGEVRSFSREGIRRQLDLMKRAFRESAGDESRLVFTPVSEFEPYIHAQDAPAVVHLERALSAVGLTPQPIRYMGGSDANIYNAKGIPAVNVGIGAQKPHSTDEFFLLEDLDSASAIARELVRPQKE